MKKHLLSLFALASMVFASSCTSEEIVSQSTGNEVKVTFTTELRNDVKSRTVGDDTDNIDQLIFAVYDEMGNELPELRQSTHMTEDGAKKEIALTSDGKKKATIQVTLVKDQTYSFAFWAQKKGFSAYAFNPATQEVSVNYANRTANQREADAFFKGITNHKVTGTFTMDVTLKRPFAQVNFLTSQDDIINARKAGFYVKESSIKVKNVAKTLNVLTGEVSDFENTEVTFGYADLLLDEQNAIETTQINGVTGDWKYLATAYFLPQNKSEETKINATMEIKAVDVNKAVTKIVATDITAQRNYRTNIYGQLLTSNGTFNVVVDPDFEDDDHNVESGVYDVTSSSLSALLNTNKDLEGDLVYNVSGLSEESSVSVAIPDGTKASSLTLNFTDIKDGATMSIDDAAGATTKYAGTVVIKNPVDKTIQTLTVGLPEAHVILKQGNYTNVSSSTSSTTLVIANGASVGTLTVNEGYVKVEEGGDVETILRGENNPDPVTYVSFESEEDIPAEGNVGTDISFVSSTEFDVAFVEVLGGYEIGNLLGLEMFRDYVNNGDTYKGKTIKLVADIDLNNVEWTPIGNSTTKFQGTFDGQGYSISNLVVNMEGKSNVGLFGFTTDGEIKNLTVNNAKVSGYCNVGVVAGNPYTSKYTNIKVTGHVEVNGFAYVGGVGGKNAYANWTDITVDVDASSYVNANSVENGTAYRTYVGGVVGFNGEGGHSFTNITSNIDVKGSTCDVGGLFGIAHYGNKFVNCSSNGNVEITDAAEAGDAEEIGGIAGVWHNENGTTVTFTNCSFTGKLKANITEGVDLSDNTITGKAYSASGTGMLIIDGNVAVENASQLANALANGKDVLLNKSFEDIPVNTTAPYGNYYGVAQNGGVLDGNGKTLDFDLGELKEGKADNYGIMTSGGTIKNVTITGVFRGIMIMNPTQDLYIDNVTIGDEDMCYAINTGEGDGTHSLIVSNSTIKGWSSYGTAIKDLTFTNCTFAQGEYYTDVYGRLVKPYVNTVFDSCEFNSKHYIDLSAFEGTKVTLRNCTVNGVKLTAENWKDLIVAEDACGEGQISVELKDGSYLSASNIVDYVVFE